ncbi:hypothetical protein EJB05_21290, partial [Eragrostis curvula]
MPLWWWPGRRSRSRTKRKDNEPAPAAAFPPRYSVDAHPAAAWASPSVQRERPRASSLESPPAWRGADSAGRGGAGSESAVVGQGFPLPRPKSGPLPSASSQVEAAARGGGASPCPCVSSGSSSESDDAVDHRYADPVVYPGARTIPPDTHECVMEEKGRVSCSEHPRFSELPINNEAQASLQSFGASTSGPSSRGRILHEDTRGPRTRSLSPRPRGNALASSYASPGDFGFGPWSTVKRMDDLKSRSQPLPLPPVPTARFPVPSSFNSSRQSQSEWKKGKLLGSGTFGQVYLGFNRESGQLCAIKEVQVILDDSNSKERLRQLNQEIDMLRQFSHQNIVQYYGSELIDGTLSIYLEYVSGGSIHNLLRDYGPFSEPVIRNYTRQILCGLAYLHGRKTVHRDIKGANILICPSGEVKLADFGVAKHITSFVEIRSFRGSPYWMAPEVIMNKNGYSLEVDIWSLGCTVIEMGTGRHPWHQYGDVPAMFKIAYSKDVPDIPENFSNEGKDFLSLCLKRDPAQRPSATQLLGHPFVQDYMAIRATKCKITQLRDGLSFPAEACQKKVCGYVLGVPVMLLDYNEQYFVSKKIQQRTFIKEKRCSSLGHQRTKRAGFYRVFHSSSFTIRQSLQQPY